MRNEAEVEKRLISTLLSGAKTHLSGAKTHLSVDDVVIGIDSNRPEAQVKITLPLGWAFEEFGGGTSREEYVSSAKEAVDLIARASYIGFRVKQTLWDLLPETINCLRKAGGDRWEALCVTGVQGGGLEVTGETLLTERSFAAGVFPEAPAGAVIWRPLSEGK